MNDLERQEKHLRKVFCRKDNKVTPSMFSISIILLYITIVKDRKKKIL